MILLLPVLILVFAGILILGMQQFKRSLGYIWLAAVIAPLVCWIILFSINWNTIAPVSYPFLKPLPEYDFSVRFQIEPCSWPFAFSLAGLLSGVFMTEVVRFGQKSNPLTWAASLFITAAGMLSVMSATPLAFVLTWTLVDFSEWVGLMTLESRNALSLRSILAFAARFLGTFMVVAAIILAKQHGYSLQFDNMLPPESVLMLFAVGLRVGVIPLHLPFLSEPILRRGFGTLIRLVPPATSLVVLTRLPATVVPPHTAVIVMVLITLSAGFGVVNWLKSQDDIEGRPYWMIALSGLAITSSVRGFPQAAGAWGVSMILMGGLIFLFNERRSWLAYIPYFAFLGFTALPFTPLAAGLSGLTVFPFNFPDILFILIFAVLLAGTLLKIMRKAEVPDLERWMYVLYGAGLMIIVITYWMVGFFSSTFVNNLSLWWVSLIAIILAAGIVLLFRLWERLGVNHFLIRSPWVKGIGKISGALSRFASFDWLYRLAGWLSGILHRVMAFFLRVLEGEGGVLWAFLLVLLLAAFAATRKVSHVP